MYKVALFIGVEIGSEVSLSPEDTSVIVFDNNSAASSVKTAATYFYSTFLGCTYMPNADVQTRDFFNYTKEFVQKKAHLCGEEQHHSTLIGEWKFDRSFLAPIFSDLGISYTEWLVHCTYADDSIWCTNLSISRWIMHRFPLITHSRKSISPQWSLLANFIS